jgi:homoserine dehydrogenase
MAGRESLSQTREPVGIGLLGYGTVGGSVDALLQTRADDIARVVGRPVSVVRALVRDTGRTRARAPRAGLLTESFEELRDDPRVSVVAEVMGGIDPARGYISDLLSRGISVVSANKQLLARHGEELWGIAERHGAQLRFEASVCAAIPVVKVLRESMLAAGVNEVIGIVNGTTNFILSAMTRDGQPYAEALAQAQALGYAEADPTEDVNGADAAAKIAILASIAFHAHVRIDQVPYEGIDTLSADDVTFAGELGYAVKLLGRAALGADGISASVGPTLVPHGHPLARVDGSFNAVMLRGDAIREVTLQGPGAGGDETATAVIGDLLSVVGTRGTGFLQHDGYYRNLPVLAPEEAESASYIRLAVDDLPGVLAQLAGLFGAHGISLRTVVQRPRPDGTAELVLLTHPARLGDLQAALGEVQGLDCVRGETRTLRVLSD